MSKTLIFGFSIFVLTLFWSGDIFSYGYIQIVSGQLAGVILGVVGYDILKG